MTHTIVKSPAHWSTRAKPARMGLAVALLAVVSSGFCADALEYRVKAAYLYNFFLFVDWPRQAFVQDDGRFELCILGRDPFGASLTPLTKKTAQGRSIALRRLEPGADANTCHVLFIGSSEVHRVPTILRRLRAAHVLTASEVPNFARQGGVVGFTIEGGKVRLEVNLASARRAGLKVSSKLLEVASEVYR
jgi:hypothetical protein